MNIKTCCLILIAFNVLVFIPQVSKCQPSDKRVADDASYRQFAFERYGNDTILYFSPMKTYILCCKKMDSLNLNPNILTEFFVVKKGSKEIVYEDRISAACVSWNSDYELLIVKQNGIITSTFDSGKHSYVYDLVSHKKIEITHSSNTK